MPNPPVRDKLPASPVSSTRQDISPKVAKAPPTTTTAQPPALAPRPTAPAPAAPPYTAPQPQFHRFRLTDFNRAENPPNQAPAPAGQCSRFRLNDFVPYGSSFEPPPPAPLLPANGVNGDPPPPPHTGGGGGRRPSPILVPGGQGSFGVMHMDLDSSGPQKTSSSVAAAAGSGRGILQKVNVPILQQQAGMPQQRPLAPLPMNPGSKLPFTPASVPPEAVWELARVLSILRDMPADHVVKRLADALIMWPSLHEGSLLRRIGEIFPTEIPPAPNPEPEEQPTKKKRGRPPGKKGKASEAAAAAASAPAPDPRAMPPPAPSYTIPIPVTANGKKIATETDKVDIILTCTRCLKNFNPTWRATPASDPSSDATCAVKHPYNDFASGLVVTTPARKKNNYKTTWKWKCCGREVQSTSDELLMWPRKEDDRTAGWCFVGRHTVEPGVREKLGLKPGKGRKINDESNPGRKRRKVSDNTAETNGEPSVVEHPPQPPQPPQPPVNWNLPPQPGPSKPYTPPPQQPTTEAASHDSAPSPEERTKRKRGRPKGSKAKAKPKSKVSKASLPLPSTEGTDAPAESADGHGPEQQLMLEAEQHIRATAAQQDEDEDADGEPAVEQSTFWSEYAEPSAESASPALNDDDDDEDADGDGDDDNDPAISAVDLSLLASATAAMDPAIGIAAASDTEQPIEKRKRGRPKGSKNAKIVTQSSENLQQKSPKVKPAEVTTATTTTTNKRATRGTVLAVGENTVKPQPTTRRNAAQPPPPQPATTDNSSTQDESGNGDGNGVFEEMGQAPIASMGMGASPATGLGGTYGGLGVVDNSEQWFRTG